MYTSNYFVTLAFVVFIGLWGVSCDEDATTSPEVPGNCDGPVTVSVSVGGDVVIDWKPSCTLSFLLVEPQGSGRDMWSLHTDSANALAPPITYGVAPEGAFERRPAEELIPGTSYDVYLYRWTGPERDDAEFAGKGEFTR